MQQLIPDIPLHNSVIKALTTDDKVSRTAHAKVRTGVTDGRSSEPLVGAQRNGRLISMPRTKISHTESNFQHAR